MPDDVALRSSRIRGPEDEIVDTLGIKMDFTAMVPREALQQFGKGAFRAVAAVHERGDDGQPQVSASVAVERGAE